MNRGGYDVVVVGAGIHGAGVAQCAAASGYRVLVLEQYGPAAGTSSRSSKLIHGGLRYLETGQLPLVRQSLAERETLLRIAPLLVHRLEFFVPVYRETRRRPWELRLGLSLYAVLGGLGPQHRFRSLGRALWGGLGGLRTEGLAAVYSYLDAQTDDAALTRAVLDSARSFGAEVSCPAAFQKATRTDAGYSIRYASAPFRRSPDRMPWHGAGQCRRPVGGAGGRKSPSSPTIGRGRTGTGCAPAPGRARPGRGPSMSSRLPTGARCSSCRGRAGP